MDRNRSLFSRGRTPVALLILAILTVLVLPAFAQVDGPGQPAVPNIEPTELAAATPPIWTLSEREAVEATLAAYFASGQLSAPAGTTIQLSDLQAMDDAALAATYRVYLPFIRRSPGLDQVTPTPVTPTPVTPTPETPTPEPEDPADVVVTLWPKPSILVARGAIIEYEFRVKNVGPGTATGTKVIFPYNSSQMTLRYTSLDSKAGDWLSDPRADRFTVNFGRLDSGKSRSGKVFLQVSGNVALNTILNVRANYTWSDRADGGGQRANWTPVIVGNGPSDSPYIWVQVAPDRGVAGTWHNFYTDRFLPGEGVTTWLNTPQGVRALSLRGTANGDGVVSLNYASTGLARGTYQMVLYGQRSGLTGVATFIVQ
jgi:hypothetical protein